MQFAILVNFSESKSTSTFPSSCAAHDATKTPLSGISLQVPVKRNLAELTKTEWQC